MIVSDNQLFNQQQAAEQASQAAAAAAVQESASENNNDRKSVVSSGMLKTITKLMNQATMNHRPWIFERNHTAMIVHGALICENGSYFILNSSQLTIFTKLEHENQLVSPWIFSRYKSLFLTEG